MAIEIEAGKASAKPPAASAGALLARAGRARRRVPARERQFFTERLALLLATGTPLHASVASLEQQLGDSPLRPVVAEIRQDIGGGLPFSQALGKHPRVFSSTYVHLIGAGEQGGFLPEVLQRLEELEEREARLRAALVAAFSYPAFLIVFSAAVVVFVLVAVFPKFQELFRSIADQLPVTTLLLMAASDLLRQHWMALGGGLGLALLALSRWLAGDRGGAAVDRLKLTLPGLRGLYAQLYVSQLMRVVGLSLGHGVGVLDALAASREVVKNRLFTRLIDDLEAGVSEGKGLAAGFQRAEFIPPLVRQMVTTGEEAGKLPLVMSRLADFYERELTKRLTLLSKLVEPVMLLVMGISVGLIVSSLILPIFKLSRIVH